MPSTSKAIAGPTPPDSAAAAADAPWLLTSLLSGPDRRYWTIGSFIIGLLGVATFAILTSAIAGIYIAWATPAQFDSFGELYQDAAQLMAYLPVAGAYVTVLLALQLVGCCRLPLTVRVSLVYAILFISLAAVLGNFEQPVDPMYVICAAPLALGGFVLRRYGDWNAVSWNQFARSSGKLSIATLLDVTASIALTIWFISLSRHAHNPAAYLCFVPAAVAGGVIGLHGWARLMAICSDSSDVTSGFAFWMAGNIGLGCLVWLTLAVAVNQPSQGLMGLIGALLVVVVAQLWTEIPIRWLRGCGWTLRRAASD